MLHKAAGIGRLWVTCQITFVRSLIYEDEIIIVYRSGQPIIKCAFNKD